MQHILPGLVALFPLLMFISDARANELAVGQPAPDFELADQDSRLHSLEDYRDRWVVLYFYPKDGTPGCTTEACEFRDNIFAYRDLNAHVLGISLDDIESHRAFAEEHGLPFPLLADVNGDVAEAYGVKTRMFGFTLARRQTFIIDPGGRIARHYAKVKPASHSAEVLADLEALIESANTAEPSAGNANRFPGPDPLPIHGIFGQEFACTGDFPIERNTGLYFRVRKIRCAGKGQARNRAIGNGSGLTRSGLVQRLDAVVEPGDRQWIHPVIHEFPRQLD